MPNSTNACDRSDVGESSISQHPFGRRIPQAKNQLCVATISSIQTAQELYRIPFSRYNYIDWIGPILKFASLNSDCSGKTRCFIFLKVAVIELRLMGILRGSSKSLALVLRGQIPLLSRFNRMTKLRDASSALTLACDLPLPLRASRSTRWRGSSMRHVVAPSGCTTRSRRGSGPANPL